MTYRIGLMGCGTVADYGHLPTILATAGFELTALYDPDEDRLDAAQTKFGAPYAFTDPEGFFGCGLDVVTVTSPPPCHLENVCAAARHAVPVLCEKPLAMTDADAALMIERMQEAGVPLFVGFDYRFSPVSRRIRELLAAGAIGTVRELRLVYLWGLHGRYDKAHPSGLNQRREARMAEGGPLVDCGVHQIDLARWWLGAEVVRQRAVGVWVEGYRAPDHVYLHLDHAGGVHTLVEMSYSYGATLAQPRPRFEYEIIGTDGLIRYDRGARTFELHTAAGATDLGFAPEKNFAGMYKALLAALESGDDSLLPTGEDGLIATRIARGATDALIAEHET